MSSSEAHKKMVEKYHKFIVYVFTLIKNYDQGT